MFFQFLTINQSYSHLILGNLSILKNLRHDYSGIEHLNIKSQQFPIPGSISWPYYPLFDKFRNVIWVGDTSMDSGRIWEFNITDSKYTAHKLGNISIVTALALDHHKVLWYLDPVTRRLGFYNPNSDTNIGVYDIKTNDTLFGIAIDNKDVVWMTSPNNKQVLRFDTHTKQFRAPVQLPFSTSRPLGIVFDGNHTLWIADEVGSIAKIDSGG